MARFSGNQPNPAPEPKSNPTPVLNSRVRYQGKPKKKGWYHSVSRAMAWLFKTLLKVVELIKELFEHLLSLLGSSFELGATFWTSPFTHYVASILLFLGLMVFALHQWFVIGNWAGHLIRVKGGALAGLIFGTFLNLYQLSPMLWKIDNRIAKAYAKAQINPHFEPEDEESPSNRDKNWSNHAHRALKTRSSISYIAEWGAYLGYWVVGLKFSLVGLVFGAIALLFPQWALAMALHNQEIMRQTMAYIEEDQDGVPSTVNL